MPTVAGLLNVFMRADWSQYNPQPGSIHVVVCEIDPAVRPRGCTAAEKAWCEFISAWVKDNQISLADPSFPDPVDNIEDYGNILIPKSAGRNLKQAINRQFPDNLIKVNGVYYQIEMA